MINRSTSLIQINAFVLYYNSLYNYLHILFLFISYILMQLSFVVSVTHTYNIVFLHIVVRTILIYN